MKWIYSHSKIIFPLWIALVLIGAAVCVFLTDFPAVLAVLLFLVLTLCPLLFITHKLNKECAWAVKKLDEGEPEDLLVFVRSFPKRDLMLSLNEAVALEEIGLKREAYELLLSAKPRRFAAPMLAVLYYNNLACHAEHAETKRAHYDPAKSYLVAVRATGQLVALTHQLRSTEAEVLFAEGKHEECLAVTEELLSGNLSKRGRASLLLLRAKCLIKEKGERDEISALLNEVVSLALKLSSAKEARELLKGINE